MQCSSLSQTRKCLSYPQNALFLYAILLTLYLGTIPFELPAPWTGPQPHFIYPTFLRLQGERGGEGKGGVLSYDEPPLSRLGSGFSGSHINV